MTKEQQAKHIKYLSGVWGNSGEIDDKTKEAIKLIINTLTSIKNADSLIKKLIQERSKK
jgi:hypothetical protein